MGGIIMMNDGWRGNMYAQLPDNGCDGFSGPTGGQRHQRPGGLAMDRTTEKLSSLVCDLHYHDLTPQTVHQVKRVLVDTLACALGGYLSEPAKIARQLASTVKSDSEHGARIMSTRESSSQELAGFTNAEMVSYM